MKRIINIIALTLIMAGVASARIRYVDKNGGTDQFGRQKYTTIQSAIDAAIDGDTVRIFPGIYNEKINIGKNIVVQGGGLNTIINVTNITSDNAVTITNGKLMWIGVHSTANGIGVANATVTNCIASDCSYSGFVTWGTNSILNNCISINNKDGYWLVRDQNATLIATNCLAVWNKESGFRVDQYDAWHPTLIGRYCCSYGNKYNYAGNNVGWMTENLKLTYCIEENPSFSTDFRIAKTSKCFDGGDYSVFDLDGTRSDMGYYGGPDAPLLPYITFPQNYRLNNDGTMQWDMLGKVGY